MGMNKREVREAKAMLKTHTQRMETAICDGGGQTVTAYWSEGGQRLFYTLREVDGWWNDYHNRIEQQLAYEAEDAAREERIAKLKSESL